MNAAQKRYKALARLSDQLLKRDGTLADDLTVTWVCDQIKGLHKLGRTDRWHNALDRWHGMVQEALTAEDRAKHLHWAIVQGGVYAGYAAD